MELNLIYVKITLLVKKYNINKIVLLSAIMIQMSVIKIKEIIFN